MRNIEGDTREGLLHTLLSAMARQFLVVRGASSSQTQKCLLTIQHVGRHFARMFVLELFEYLFSWSTSPDIS